MNLLALLNNFKFIKESESLKHLKKIILFIALFVTNFSFSQCLQLTTTPQWVDIGDVDVIGSQVTVEALVYYTGGVNVVSKHTGPPNVNYLLRLTTFELTTTSGFYFMSNPYVMNANTWYHIAGTYDGTNIKYYVNGCLVITLPATGNLLNQNLATAIGNQSACQCEQYFGSIDEVRIWNVARTQAQIQANMNNLPSPTTQPGLLTYYKFTNNLVNAQGNATYDGVSVGAAPVYAAEPPIIAIPAITAVPSSTSICIGQTATLTATGGVSYTWTPVNQNGASITVAPAATTVYSVTGTSAFGCTTSSTLSLVADPLPIVTPGSNSPVCAGETLSLTAGAFPTTIWTGPNTFTSIIQNPTIANVTAAEAGTYTITVTDAKGCVNTGSTNVVINPLPVITVNNPTVCVNQTINLSANGGTGYFWSGPLAYTSTLQNPSIPNAAVNMSGTYNVIVTTAAGCSNTAVSNVTVYPLPTPTITSNSPICAGQTLNLFGGGGANYAWSGPGYTGLAQNPTINNSNTTASGIYTLLISSGTCTASTTHTVVINPLPIFNFSGNNVMCNGQSSGASTVNVTVGTGPFNYAWSTIPSQTTQVVSNLAAGTYSCVVTDANNCSNIASTQITEPTQFTVSISSATTQACTNTPINVNANGAGGTGPYTYNWVSGPSTTGYSVNETLAGSYTYTVNATDAFNCPGSDTINLTFFPQPSVSATSETICTGESTALTASGATTYTWQPGNITGATYPYNGNTSINVSVIGSSNGCSSSASAGILVNPNPTSNINLSNTNGCVISCVTFSAGGSSNISSYGWMLNGSGITGSVNGVYCFDEAASYTLGLTVIDDNGCTSTAVPVYIEIYPQPVADFNHAPLQPIINQDPLVTFTDASYGTTIVSWNWYFMNTAQYTSIEQNPTFAYTEPGTYPVVLVVKSDKGCTDTLIRPLVVGEDYGIYVPNAFTPNADGWNDTFQPKGFGIVKYEMNIFDRWGEKVFSTKDFELGWDGTMQSKKDVKYGTLEEGTYVWLINVTNVFGKSHELKGHVTLLR